MQKPRPVRWNTVDLRKGDDRFAVRFVYDITNKPSGQRMKMDEVGVFAVENGKVVREEYFYSMGG